MEGHSENGLEVEKEDGKEAKKNYCERGGGGRGGGGKEEEERRRRYINFFFFMIVSLITFHHLWCCLTFICFAQTVFSYSHIQPCHKLKAKTNVLPPSPFPLRQ